MKITQNELNKIKEKGNCEKLKKLIGKSIIFIGATVVTGVFLIEYATVLAVHRISKDFDYNHELTSISVENNINDSENFIKVTDELKNDFNHNISYTVFAPLAYSGNDAVIYEISIEPSKLEEFQKETGIIIDDLIIDNKINYNSLISLIQKTSLIEDIAIVTRKIDNHYNENLNFGITKLQVTTGNYELINIPRNETVEYLLDNDIKLQLDITLCSIFALAMGISTTTLVSIVIDTFEKDKELMNSIKEKPAERKIIKQ